MPYAPKWEQLQTLPSVNTGNYSMDKHTHKIKEKLQASTGGNNILIQKSKQTIKQTKMTSVN
jgi:hypothetical protein